MTPGIETGGIGITSGRTWSLMAGALCAALSGGPAVAHDGHAHPPSAVVAPLVSAPPVVDAETADPFEAIPGIGGPFTLVDHTGATRTDRDFHGRLMLVVFGFTRCPEACPTDLLSIAHALDELGPDAAVTPVFVTVDPEYDTPERLAAFVGKFHPAIVGLTGDRDAVAGTIRAYRVHAAQLPEGAPQQVAHTSFLYLMGKEGGFLSMMLPNPTAEEIAARIRKYL